MNLPFAIKFPENGAIIFNPPPQALATFPTLRMRGEKTGDKAWSSSPREATPRTTD